MKTLVKELFVRYSYVKHQGSAMNYQEITGYDWVILPLYEDSVTEDVLWGFEEENKYEITILSVNTI